MPRLTTACLLVSLSLSSLATAGSRAPGKYSGVVVFDRWAGCILFSGVYLMYVSEDVKDSVREYEGQAVEVEALEVLQPINPGDGLIRRLNVLGPAHPKQNSYTVEGTKLEAQPTAVRPLYATFTLTITNQGSGVAWISSSQIGFALLAQRTAENSSISPSDGPSTAVITRTNVLSGHGNCEVPIGNRMISYSHVIPHEDRLPAAFGLAPHESKATKITFMLPPGS